MKYRKLRIAWSVFWGLACVLLIVMWVRSYGRIESIYVPCGSKHVVICESFAGLLGASDQDFNLGQLYWISHTEIPDWRTYRAGKGFSEIVVGGLQTKASHFSLVIPHWIAILATAVFTVAPWASRFKRFSLRTLLIATTLVAVVLGLAVWAAQN